MYIQRYLWREASSGASTASSCATRHASRNATSPTASPDRLYIVYRQSPLGPIDPSFRSLSGRLKLTVRRHKFNKDSPSREWSTQGGPLVTPTVAGQSAMV